MDFPRLWEPVVLGGAGIVCIAYAWKAEGAADWLRLVAVLLGIFFLAGGAVSGINWLAAQYTVRLGEYQSARARGFQSVAQAVRGLNPQQLSAVTLYQNLEVTGRLGNDRVLFSLQGMTQNVPMEFVGDFLAMSEETVPYLWPIREHEYIRNASGARWANAETMATEVTNLLVRAGWAEKAVGPNSARLLIPLDNVYKRLGLEE